MVQTRDLNRLIELSKKPAVTHGYIATKSPKDLGALEDPPKNEKFMRAPLSLLYYWLGEAEFVQRNILNPVTKGLKEGE